MSKPNCAALAGRAARTSLPFKICAWRTNDAKNDLAHGSFLSFASELSGARAMR